MSVVYYHVTDPVQNLCIGIDLKCVLDNSATIESSESRNITSAANTPDGSEDEDETLGGKIKPTNSNKKTKASKNTTITEWSESFGWQEKKFGPREILKYYPRSEQDAAAKTAVEAEYCDIMRRRIRYGENIFANVSNVMLFSYTDKDSFVPKTELTKFVSTSEDFDLNSMAESIVTLPENSMLDMDRDSEEEDDLTYDDKDYASLTNRQRRKHWTVNSAGHRLFRENPFKIFYIMCSVDIDTSSFEALGQQGSNTNREEDGLMDLDRYRKHCKFYEVVLCVIKVSNDGTMMEMVPGFSTSRMFEENTDDPAKRKWYRFTSPSGSVFEYSITNLADSHNKSLEKEINAIKRLQLEETYSSIENRIPTSLDYKLESSATTLYIVYLEIVSLEKFEDAASDRLYVQYEVSLPRNSRWTWVSSTAPTFPHSGQCDSNYRLCGITQTCKCKYLKRRSKNVRALLGLPVSFEEQDEDEKYVFTGHIGFPLEMSLLYHRTETEEDHIEQLRMPTIYFQVKSRDMFDRHRVEGYGYVNISRNPGVLATNVRTWKVAGSLTQKSSEYFVGGALQLDSSMYASFPQSQSGTFLNRYGFTSKTSGDVRIKLQTITQDYVHPRVTTELNERIRGQRMQGVTKNLEQQENQDKKKLNQRRRTVNEIINSLKYGNTSAARATEGSSEIVSAIASLRRKHNQSSNDEQQQQPDALL